MSLKCFKYTNIRKGLCFCVIVTKKKTGHSRSRSPAISERSVTRNLQYDSHLKKVSEVDEIFQKLDGRHKDDYTPEHLRAWAHLIHMDKHNSFESPPGLLFFFEDTRLTNLQPQMVSLRKSLHLQ